MIAKSENFSVQKTARYSILGEPGPDVEQVWFALHGYGQLCYEFISNFYAIASPKTLIIAPEALSRFYMNGTTGKIGASWMTREDRLNEINDYINYLDSLYLHIMEKLTPHKKKSVHVLGFSQGTATACRWVLQGESPIQQLTLWGGGLPEDIPWHQCREKLSELKINLVYGDKDPLVKSAYLDQQIQLLKQYTSNYNLTKFDGFHSMNTTILKQLSGA